MSEIFKLSFNPTAIIVDELPLSNWTIVNTNTLSINGDTITQLGVGGWYESMFVSFTVPETGSYKISYDYNITNAKVGNHGTYGFGLWLTTNNPNVTGDAQYNFYMNTDNHTGGNIGSQGEDISGKSGNISFTTTLNAGTTYYLWYPGAALDDGTTYTLSFTNLCVYNNPIQYIYNNILSYPGWGGYVSYEAAPAFKTLTLYHSEGGTLTANELTGYPGDTINLSTAYNTYWRFSGYQLTGDGTIANNVYTFGDEDATICACYKVNAFTATGTFEKGSDVNCSNNNGSVATQYVGAKYAIHGAHTGEIPTAWYNSSNRWKVTTTPSAYKITLNTKMGMTGSLTNVRGYTNATNATAWACTLIGGTQSNAQSNSYGSTNSPSPNFVYNKTVTSTSTGVNYGLSGRIQCKGMMKNEQTKYTAQMKYIASRTSGTWTATGIAP